MSPFVGDGLKEIKVRSCGKSELSGRTDRPLHCMHFDHTRRPDYNESNSGMRVTIVEHLAYHLFHQDKPEEIGLKECQNSFAIDMLNRNSVAFMQSIGKIDELDDEIADALITWETILKN